MSVTARKNIAYDARIRRVQTILNFNDADVALVAMTANVDRAALLLPADALIVGTELNVTSDFDNGAASTCKVDIGIAGSATLYLTGAADNLGTVTRTNGGAAGANIPGFAGGQQIRLTLTCSVNLSTETKGRVIVGVLYVRTDKPNGEDR